MKRPKWHAKALYLIFALALVIGLMPLTVMAGEATIVIDGPCYAKEGEPMTFTAITNYPPDSVDWYIDYVYVGTDNVPPDFTWTTTFPGGSAGPHVIKASGHWGTVVQNATLEILIGVGLIPQEEYNIIGTTATFCVPTAYNGHVLQWRLEPSPQLNGAWSVVSGGQPGNNCVTVHGSGWGELVIYADTANFTSTLPPYDYYPATTLMAIKKWGKIWDTWLFGWDEDTQQEIWDSGETQVWWCEDCKEWQGEAYLYDLIIGHFITDGGEEWDALADGADVEWWVMDARAPVHDLPSGVPASELVPMIEDMQAEWPSHHVGFGNCDTKSTATVSGDTDIDGMMTGLTGVDLVACGEESVKIVVVAKYPGGLHYDEWAVFPEIISWNFWTQEVEKVPQVAWAGSKIVLEKQFGTSYQGNLVGFKLEYQSVGTLEGINPEDYSDWQHTVWTRIDENGVARCLLTSESPGECDITCMLKSGSSQQDPIINQHGFVVFFLKFEEISLGNMQGERVYHNDGLWCPVLDSGMVYDAFQNDIFDPYATWTPDEFVGKTIRIWKGEEEPDGSITFIGDLQVREIVSNTADTIVVTPDWTTIPDPPLPTVQWYYEISDPVWDPTLDDLVQELNVSQDALLRARVKGWFMGDNLSWRDSKRVDLDGDGFAETVLPAGRWVLPDDWPILAGALWQELRPHWDIMTQPNDNIMSEIDMNLDHAEALGDYLEWTLRESPMQLDIPGALVAEFPVIGPYSTLDTYTPTIEHDYKLPVKTIVRNGKLNWWDCPMPPAKIIFEITDGPGFFKDADKADVYYEWVERDLNNPGPEGIVYTNPFYMSMIPASPFIPPFINNGGYDWDSWDDTYGPYPFWTIINQPPGMTPSNDQHPTKVEVYSDNHGEAMVWLNGDWNLDLSDWLTEAYDVPTGMVVGNTTVMAIADYPYLRKHLYVVSNDVEKTWTWGKQILGADPHEYIDFSWDPFETRMVFQVGTLDQDGKSDKKMAFIWVCDRDGFPVVGERIEWFLAPAGAEIPPITANGVSIYLPGINVENGFLAGTGGNILNPDRTRGESWTRLPTAAEKALFEKFQEYGVYPPDLDVNDYAVAAIEVLSSLPTAFDLTIYLNEREGTIIRHTNLDFTVADDPDDPVVYSVGDVGRDGTVNVLDMIRVAQHFGETGAPGWIQEDVNNDGVIDVLDLIAIGQDFTD
jgi:hypothetical protein